MNERSRDEREWQRVEVGPDHFIWVGTIDPEIQKQMPTTTRTFMQVGPLELIWHDIKRIFNPNRNIPF